MGPPYFMVVIFISKYEDAFQFFTSTNTTGIRLSKADLLKVRLLEHTPQNVQTQAARKWENTEIKLGRRQFKELISNLRQDAISNVV